MSAAGISIRGIDLSYGNNRVLLYDKAGKLLKQVAKGAGGVKPSPPIAPFTKAVNRGCRATTCLSGAARAG